MERRDLGNRGSPVDQGSYEEALTRLLSIWREFCALQNIFILRFVVINSIKLLSFVCLVVVQEREMVTTSPM